MSGWHQEQEYQAGVRAERERIIKLLGELGDDCHCEDCWNGKHPVNHYDHAIALIKGEN